MVSWQSEGILISTRKHGETSLIIEVMTPDYGRHLGLVRGGRSKRMRAVLQLGNKLNLEWKARLSEQLGLFQVELITSRMAELMANSQSLYLAQILAAHCRLLPERDPHLKLYEKFDVMMSMLDKPESVSALLVHFELDLLRELGFGLDLSQCAANGTQEDLAYVSPKSGRAVSREAGQPYHDKLLPLPSFVKDTPDGQNWPHALDVKHGLSLTQFFLDRHIWQPRGLKPPEMRERIGG